MKRIAAFGRHLGRFVVELWRQRQSSLIPDQGLGFVLAVIKGAIVSISVREVSQMHNRYFWRGVDPVKFYYLCPRLDWHLKTREIDADHFEEYLQCLSMVEETIGCHVPKITPSQFILPNPELVVVKNPTGLPLLHGTLNFNSQYVLPTGSVVKVVGGEMTDDQGITRTVCHVISKERCPGLLFLLDVKEVARLQRFNQDLSIVYLQNKETCERADALFKSELERQKNQISTILETQKTE